jgi:hypothetical protein
VVEHRRYATEPATEKLNSFGQEKKMMPAMDYWNGQIREIWRTSACAELNLAASGLSALHIICNTLIVADEFFPRPASFRCWAKSGDGHGCGSSCGS